MCRVICAGRFGWAWVCARERELFKRDRGWRSASCYPTRALKPLTACDDGGSEACERVEG